MLAHPPRVAELMPQNRHRPIRQAWGKNNTRRLTLCSLWLPEACIYSNHNLGGSADKTAPEKTDDILARRECRPQD